MVKATMEQNTVQDAYPPSDSFTMPSTASLQGVPPSVLAQMYSETPATDPQRTQISGALQSYRLRHDANEARSATQHQMQRSQQQLQRHNLQAGSSQPPPVDYRTGLSGEPAPHNRKLGGNPTASVPGADEQSAVRPNSGILSIEQTQLLQNHIHAFRLLYRNKPLPPHFREALGFSDPDPVSEKPPTVNGDQIQAKVEAVDLRSSSAAQNRRSRPDTFTDPVVLLDRKLPIHTSAGRDARNFAPCLLSRGIDNDGLIHQRQQLLFARLASRRVELEARSATTESYRSSATAERYLSDETSKLKAMIELKKLGLVQKQRDLRAKISRDLLLSDSLAVAANRALYRRQKVPQARDSQITERLDRDYRNARLDKERHVHREYILALVQQNQEIKKANVEEHSRRQRLGRAMLQTHQAIEKEEQKRVERTAKQRLQALKANDEEAYLKLLDQAKDTRITHLLRQTDGFLNQLTASVRAQQKIANLKSGTDGANLNGEGKEDESDDSDTADFDDEDDAQRDGENDAQNRANRAGAKVDYYEVAHRIKESVTKQPDMLEGGTLKEYQVKGLQWMISLYNNNLNGILADEMGLGKTIQTISLVTYLIEKKQQKGPFLILAPLSTLSNWSLEFDRWAPSVRKIVYKGPPNSRKRHHQAIKYGEFEALLTTYEFIIKDRQVLSKLKWTYMIVDEGHRMKNASSKLVSTITQYYTSRYRLILTGTPLQNNLPELWALLNFVLPTIFKSVKSFDEWFNTPFANTGGQDKIELTEEEQLLVIRRLHKVLRPFLLRRLKKDVEKDLPEKQERVIKCKFSALQAKLYKDLVNTNTLWVSGKSGRTNLRGLSNVLMQLRKVCNHPFVFEEVEDSLLTANVSPGGNRAVNDMIWRTAGKFELLDRILPKFLATGHRILMFFQMTQIMTIMGDYLDFRHHKYLRLDGGTKSEDRQDLLKEFNTPDSPFDIFLLSTRAGGLGLNLQTADTVIIFDSDWNPHQDLQAQDRAHRIGQKNEVRILRLITSNSVEEKILERAQFKLDMDGKVIQAGKFDNKSSESDRDAMLRTLLDAQEQADCLGEEEMDDDDLNDIMARSEEEIEAFRKIDAERDKVSLYGPSKSLQRLIQPEELPEIWLKEPTQDDDKEEEFLGRGARERAAIKYDDGLTEEQWADAVDASDDDPDAARERKEARINKRKFNREQREKGEVLSAGSESPVEACSPSPPPKALSKKPRGRKPGPGNKRKPDESGFEESAQPPKKHRGRWPKKVDTLTPDERNRLQSILNHTYQTIMDLKVAVTSDIEHVESVPSPSGTLDRLVATLFRRLPDKKIFADYYQIIPEPICLDQIKKRIDKKDYDQLEDFGRDLDRLCENARLYNEDRSDIYKDAGLIQAEMRRVSQASTRQEGAVKNRAALNEADGMASTAGDDGIQATVERGEEAGVISHAPFTKIKLTLKTPQAEETQE